MVRSAKRFANISNVSGFRFDSQILRESFSLKMVVYCLITILMMALHAYLPAQTKMLVPSKDFSTSLFTDGAPDGAKAHWVNEDKLMFECEIPQEKSSNHCGFNIVTDPEQNGLGIDLAKYDRIKFIVDYQGGNQRFRFFTRSFAQGFSTLMQTETYQFNNALIPKDYLNSDLEIALTEFTVAEWWITDFKAPRKLMHTDFSQTQTIGFDLSYPVVQGIHRFQIKKVELIGLWVSKETWYLSILIFWIIAGFLKGSYNLWKLNRQYRLEHEQLDELLKENSSLIVETDKYKKLSMQDELTGLLNRYGLSQYIQKNYSGDDSKNVSLIIIDIDFFKLVNDTYGHTSGDIVLQAVANLIGSKVRTSDVAARWGGEEFVLLLPNTPLSEAQKVAEKLRVLAETLKIDSLPEIKVTISLGVGCTAEHEAFHHLFRRVDTALYKAKHDGRNRVQVSA